LIGWCRRVKATHRVDYGTIPIVRATDRPANGIRPDDPESKRGINDPYGPYRLNVGAAAFSPTLQEALDAFSLARSVETPHGTGYTSGFLEEDIGTGICEVVIRAMTKRRRALALV
jgi:hypothetical protein